MMEKELKWYVFCESATKLLEGDLMVHTYDWTIPYAEQCLNLSGEYQDPHMLVRDLRVLAPRAHPDKHGWSWLPVRDAVENILN